MKNDTCLLVIKNVHEKTVYFHNKINNEKGDNLSSRVQWIDYAKGVGILSIILGHSGFPQMKYLFWFHVPLFFIISGFLNKRGYEQKFTDFFRKKIISLWIPYYVYGILCILLFQVLVWEFDASFICKELLKLIYSGTKVTGIIGAFWFIPVLFFTEIIFYFYQKINKKAIKIAFLFTCYFTFQLVFQYITLPMDINVIPIAIVFFSIGVYMKENWQWRVIISKLAIVILLVFMFFFHLKLVDLNIDLKNAVASPLIINIIVPVAICQLIFVISIFLEKKKGLPLNMLAFFGKESLYFMLTHNLIINFLEVKGVHSWYIVFIITIIVSLLLYYPIVLITQYIIKLINVSNWRS
ncbi:acyltransferase family protein [Enterococcus sp. DIV0724b]|uniref:acyltransferase family protein n=1 Tax=Enterococcus sp. DIV0724b TaxID=2774694 RepID=UPI003D2FDA8F